LGRSPFVGKSQKDTMERICAVRYELPTGVMTQGPEDLIRGLLVMEAHARMPLARILCHPWVTAARSERDADAHDDSGGLDATRAALFRRVASASPGPENGNGADIDATRIASRRIPAAAAKVDSDATCALDNTVIMPRRQAPEPLAAKGLDATCIVPRKRPERGDADSRACASRSYFATRFASCGPQASCDAELLSVAEDKRIGMDTLAELDVRFLGAPVSGCSSTTEADFWIIRTEVAASRHPRPKARARRGPGQVSENY